MWAPKWRVPFSLYHLQSERSGGSFSAEGQIAGKWTSERPSVGAIDPESSAALRRCDGRTDGRTDGRRDEGWRLERVRRSIFMN